MTIRRIIVFSAAILTCGAALALFAAPAVGSVPARTLVAADAEPSTPAARHTGFSAWRVADRGGEWGKGRQFVRGGKDNSILLAIIRQNDPDTRAIRFTVFVDIELPNVPGVTAVSGVSGGGIDIDFESEGPFFWTVEGEFDTLEDVQEVLHGSWTINISGAVSSTSTFTFNANALTDADIFSLPAPIHPEPDGSFAVHDVFEWKPPASGPFPAYLISVFVDYLSKEGPSEGPEDFLPGDAVTWQPEDPLEPGPAAFAVGYFSVASASLLSPITVTSGSVPGGWGLSELAPPGYPDATPLVALGGERFLTFTVTGCPQLDGLNWVLLGIDRINDPSAPNAQYAVSIDVNTAGIGGVTGVTVITGNGTRLDLVTDLEEDHQWLEPERLLFPALPPARTFVHGAWTVEIHGCTPSTSTFTVDADRIAEPDFFDPPAIAFPKTGTPNVPPNAVFSWMPPETGPYPPLVLSVWIDWMNPFGFFESGPEAFLPINATSWDPGEPLRTGPARWVVGYYNALPSKWISELTIVKGNVPGGWEVEPVVLKFVPDWPESTPFFSLGGEAFSFITIAGCEPNADLVCDASPIQWAAPVSGLFTDGSRWVGGKAPGEEDAVSFGLTSGEERFDVFFAGDAASRSLCVETQSPVFELGGNVYQVAEHAIIGPEGPAELFVTNGTLASPITLIGRFGTLWGDGAIGGDLENAGRLRPSSRASDTGTLTVLGHYSQTACGSFEPMLGGPIEGESSRLHVTGAAALSGPMRVRVAAGASPEIGESFTVLTAATILNNFSGAVVPFLGVDRVAQVGIESFEPREDGSGGVAGASQGIVITIGVPGASPEFDEAQFVALEGEPTAITSASVGKSVDGRDLALAIAAADSNDPGVALVLLNSGDGSAYTPVLVEVGIEPVAIVAGDFAGTGEEGFAVANHGEDTVSILLYDGAGDFAVATVNVGSQPRAIAAGDFRGMGLIDLAVANQGDDTVSILFNDGTGGFSPAQTIAVGAQPVSIAAAAFLGGRAPDLAVANFADGTITLLENDGGGGFFPIAALPAGAEPLSLKAEDIEDNKDIDLIVTNPAMGGVSVLLNFGGGNFSQPINLPVNGAPVSFDAWDMDGDGDIDLAVIVDDEELGPVTRLLRNDSMPGGGPLTFTLFDPLDEGASPRLVLGADVTGDGADDLITVNVTELATTGKPAPALAIRPNLFGKPPVLGDLNGDGHVDVQDLLILLSSWGQCPKQGDCPADLNKSGSVDVQDLLILLANWG